MTDSKLLRPHPWTFSLAVASLAALVAVIQLGRLHPDEVYQFLEPAWLKVHGYGVKAWEWEAGLRNWAIPLFFAGILRLCDALGVEHPRVYRVLIEVPQLLLHAWMLLAVYRYSERRVGSSWAYVAVLAVGLYGVVVAFAGRTMGESFSIAFFIVGAEALDRTERPARAGLIGGAMLGLSVVARYGSAVLVAATLVWLLGARAWRRLAFTCLAGAAVALALGLLDKITWNEWFHSLRTYTDFNVLKDTAAIRFGREPATYYLPWLLIAPAWVWPGVVYAVMRQRPRISLPLFAGAVYLVAVTATAHKEARFLYPALVCLAVAGAPGLLGLLASIRRPDVRGSLAALSVAVGAGTFFIPGELQPQRGDQFRAIVEATRPPEVTGLLIVNEGIWGAGGSFYIGKKIPWLNADWPQEYGFQMAMRDPRFNRVVSYDGRAIAELQARGFRVIDEVGKETILAR